MPKFWHWGIAATVHQGRLERVAMHSNIIANLSFMMPQIVSSFCRHSYMVQLSDSGELLQQPVTSRVPPIISRVEAVCDRDVCCVAAMLNSFLSVLQRLLNGLVTPCMGQQHD